MKYSFALMDERGVVKQYHAPSEYKAKQLRKKVLKSSKLKFLAVSNIMRQGKLKPLAMLFNVKVSFAKK